MVPRRLIQRALRASLPFFVFPVTSTPQVQPKAGFPYPEKLWYRIEWRLVNAGNAEIDMSRRGAIGWSVDMKLESAGLVTRLYRVEDTYKLTTTDRFCGENVTLDAQEGKRHNVTELTFQTIPHKVLFMEHDLVKKQDTKKELDVPACTYDVVGALAMLRTLSLEPGKSITVPVTNGKKLANVRIEAQAKENVTIAGKTYPAIRYEAFLFDNVLYKRHGRMLLWMTDDSERIPVQFRMQMGFPIGTITVELEKREKS